MTPLILQLNPSPPPIETFEDDFPAFLDRLTGLIEGMAPVGFLEGVQNGAVPTDNQGIVLTDSLWQGWSETDQKYLPLPLAGGSYDPVSNTRATAQLIGKAQSGDVNLNLPDVNGATLLTLEKLNDMTGGLGMTRSLSGTEFSVDWGNRYVLVPTDSFSIKEGLDGEDGSTIDLWILVPINTLSPWGIAWPKNWFIGTGALPSTGPGAYKITHIEVSNVSGVKLITFKADYVFGTAGRPKDTTAPTVTNNNVVAGTNEILIFVSEVLNGGNLDVSKFTVNRDGVDNPVLSATASGALIRLTVRDPYNTNNTGDVTYAGTIITDPAGNTMAGFNIAALKIVGASHVTVLRGASIAGGVLIH